jgi:hypothetical protein
MLFFELWAQSGFGDRILDLWSVIVVTRILGEKCVCKWLSGSQYPGFHSEYDTSLFTLPDTTWAKPDQAPPINKDTIFGSNGKIWGHYMLNVLPKGIINNQIFPLNTFWGTTSIDRIYHGLDFYGLHNISHKELLDEYFYMTKNTVPCKKLNDRINTEGAIGIHIRLSDKCVDVPNDFTMSKDEYENIKRKCKDFIAQQDPSDSNFFVCSEDQTACNDMKMYIQGLGKTVVNVDHTDLKHDEHAILDFFSLSRCKFIVQCTKYSTFSIAASLINNIPLVNMYGYERNALKIWSKTSDIRNL